MLTVELRTVAVTDHKEVTMHMKPAGYVLLSPMHDDNGERLFFGTYNTLKEAESDRRKVEGHFAGSSVIPIYEPRHLTASLAQEAEHQH